MSMKTEVGRTKKRGGMIKMPLCISVCVWVCVLGPGGCEGCGRFVRCCAKALHIFMFLKSLLHI